MPNPSGSTAEYGFPYLRETDAPDIPTAQQLLAQAVENLLKTWRIGTMGLCGSTPPAGALLCEGQAVSRVTYAGLFSKWGTRFGNGDGVTTFNLANLCGRLATANANVFVFYE